jgi:RNA-dependent RNA polymerase
MASFGGPLSFMINLRERALFVYFQSTVRLSSNERVKVTQPFFRLRVPLFRLTRIWKMQNEASKEVSFLIVLDSPPVYHRQLENFKLTFQSDTSWRETDTWYRQTSIAHNTGFQKYVATNLNRPEQIINIGELNWSKLLVLRIQINCLPQVDGMRSRSPYPPSLPKPEPSS